MHTSSFKLILASIAMVSIGVMPLISTPALGLEEAVLLARRPKVPESDEVAVTEAAIETRLVANTPYYYLNGVIQNKGTEKAIDLGFYFEIYEPGTEKIIDAGSFVITPPILRPGGSISFTRNVSANGTVRITLVRWRNSDRAPFKNVQMQLFSETQATE